MNKPSIKVGQKIIKGHGSRFSTAILSLALLAGMSACQSVQNTKTYSQTTELPKGLHTPDIVETSIGTLKLWMVGITW